MMLAAIGDYFFWWQVPLLLLLLLVWVLGGGVLLWVGGRFIAKLPRATFGRSFAANILAGIAGVAGMLLVSLTVFVVGPPGSMLGWAAGLVIAWLVIKAMFSASFGKAILAWLPTIPVGVIGMALMVSIMLPALARAKELAMRSLCRTNVEAIRTALATYAGDNDNQYPPGLDRLAGAGLAPRQIKCPSAGSSLESPGSDYFYLPPAGNARPGTMILCDFRDNHREEGRNVLFENGTVKWMSEADFQAELAGPHNAAFAKALRAAEAHRRR